MRSKYIQKYHFNYKSDNRDGLYYTFRHTSEIERCDLLMYVVHHEDRGFLADDKNNGQYYSEKLNKEVILFETYEDAKLLCGIYEKPMRVVLVEEKEEQKRKTIVQNFSDLEGKVIALADSPANSETFTIVTTDGCVYMGEKVNTYSFWNRGESFRTYEKKVLNKIYDDYSLREKLKQRGLFDFDEYQKRREEEEKVREEERKKNIRESELRLLARLKEKYEKNKYI